ncbi:MAG: NYN domain-containing protein [Pirellulales bacterium]
MLLLIDGYNLLHAAGIFPRGKASGGPLATGTLERSRNALLNYLAAALDEKLRRQTTVVFDAAYAPPGLPREVTHHGLTVRYASEYDSADTLIEELIRANATPRKLTVVSGDHRIQRAARRRRATAIDSDSWCYQLGQQRSMPFAPAEPSPSDARSQSPSSAEVDYWVRQFSDQHPDNERNDMADLEDSSQIFPPGYGDDLEDDPRD